MFSTKLISAEALVLCLSLAACSTKPEAVTPSTPTTGVREQRSATPSANQAVNPSTADTPAQQAPGIDVWAAGRRYVSTRTARNVIDLSFCPDGRVVYNDEGKARIGTFAVEGASVRAKYKETSEDYTLSADMKSVTLPGGSFVVYEGIPSCADLPKSARAD